MVHSSVVNNHIKDLRKEICNFENNLKNITVNKSILCNSDCYCQKQGNHKVTSSLYHKNCISMKKNSATVKKSDLIQPRCKSTDRKEVFHLNNKAQVEISLKSSKKGTKINEDKITKQFVDSKEKIKCRDVGCDPITILQPKILPKKCWSTVLSEKSNWNDPKPSQNFQPNVKSFSTTSSSPSVPSLFVDGWSKEKKGSIVVKDHAVQCEYTGTSTSSALNYNPVSLLYAVLNDLKSLKKNFSGKGDVSDLNSIISNMNLAMNNLPQADLTSGTPLTQQMLNELSGNKFNSSRRPARKLATKSGVMENINPPIKGLEKSLEDTCYQLQISCLKLEETCQKLRKEKDNITEQFFEKSRDLEKCLKRELEYQIKLNEAKQSVEAMSQKLDQYTKSMEELSIHVKKLQAENKALEKAEEGKANLIRQLMESSRENDKLNTEIQLMTLEKEKNRVLLEIKDQELAKLKAELRSIGGLVSEKILESMMAGEDTLVSPRLEFSETKELAFSSPDGSMTYPSKSWQAMSSIVSPTRPHKPPVSTICIQAKGGTDKTDHKNPLESINHLKNELRELFAQMKQQTELSETILPDIQPGVVPSPWTTVTDSTDGYNSITEHELSEVT